MAARSSKAWMLHALVLVLTCLISVQAGTEPAPRVFAILSSNAAPYREHLDKFEASFNGRVKRVVLPEKTGRLTRKLTNDPPDLILALGGKAARYAADSGAPAPIMFTMVYDPDEYGLAGEPSLCGLTLKAPLETTMQALETVRPRNKPRLKVGVLHNPENGDDEIGPLRRLLSKRGHALTVKELSSPDELEDALGSLLPKVDALWLLAEPDLMPDASYIRLALNRALDRKVAVIGVSDQHVRSGALLAVSVDYRMEGAHAAKIAERVLAGEEPEDIGILEPQNLIWSINLKVADEIGWKVSPMARKKFERVHP